MRNEILDLVGRASQLQHLALTTDPNCIGIGFEVDLSSFVNLKRLCWRSPHFKNVKALSNVILANAEHLEMLELSFNDKIQDEVLPDCSFPALRELSLASVSLTAHMARTFCPQTLQSITLRECPSWHDFLCGLTQESPLQLKTLEIQEYFGTSAEPGDIVDLIRSFGGLES